MLEELNLRAISTVEFIYARDGADELADAAAEFWPAAKVRSGVEALVENSLR
jgi:hypothetical protein